MGRSKDALATLARARELDSSNAMLFVSTATVLLMAGDRDAARAQFEAALRMNADLARAHSSLGILDLEDGRPAAAVARWKAATAVDRANSRSFWQPVFRWPSAPNGRGASSVGVLRRQRTPGTIRGRCPAGTGVSAEAPVNARRYNRGIVSGRIAAVPNTQLFRVGCRAARGVTGVGRGSGTVD